MKNQKLFLLLISSFILGHGFVHAMQQGGKMTYEEFLKMHAQKQQEEAQAQAEKAQEQAKITQKKDTRRDKFIQAVSLGDLASFNKLIAEGYQPAPNDNFLPEAIKAENLSIIKSLVENYNMQPDQNIHPHRGQFFAILTPMDTAFDILKEAIIVDELNKVLPIVQYLRGKIDKPLHSISPQKVISFIQESSGEYLAKLPLDLQVYLFESLGKPGLEANLKGIAFNKLDPKAQQAIKSYLASHEVD